MSPTYQKTSCVHGTSHMKDASWPSLTVRFLWIIVMAVLVFVAGG